MSPVNRSSVVVGQASQDLTLAQFTAILAAGSSPALVEADRCYQAIKGTGVSVAFATAIFLHESTLGTEGFAVVNKNPGNTRTSTTGIGIPVTTVKGQFIRYPNWYEGFRDMAWRLVKPDYYYALEGRRTIEQIITRWAPPEDGNDTPAYIESVVNNMSEWIGSSNNMADLFPTADQLGLPANMVRIHKAADIGPLRPLGQVKWNIGHDTQGGAVGSEYTLTANDGNVASCHAMIDLDGTTVLMVPLDYTAWTPGNDFYAERSINIELVGWQTGPYTEAQYRSYAAYYKWAVAQGCPIANTYIGKKGLATGHLGHEDVPNPLGPGYGGASGHTDPGAYFLWDKLVEYCGGNVAVFDPNPKKLTVGPGMLDFAKLHQLKFITNEQWFDPSAGQPGLGKSSRAWVQDSSGVTYVLMASEEPELAKPGETTPWKVEQLKLI